METGRKRIGDEGAGALAPQVDDFHLNGSRLRQLETNGRRRIEGVGAVLRQFKCLYRLGDFAKFQLPGSQLANLERAPFLQQILGSLTGIIHFLNHPDLCGELRPVSRSNGEPIVIRLDLAPPSIRAMAR